MVNEQYKKFYTEGAFKNFVKRFNNLSLIEDALAMYYCLTDSETPATIKGAIVIALGYLICPIDVTPDIIPVIGFLDDAGVIATAMMVVKAYIKPEHREKAHFWLLSFKGIIHN